jgi:hypothetical protein
MYGKIYLWPQVNQALFLLIWLKSRSCPSAFSRSPSYRMSVIYGVPIKSETLGTVFLTYTICSIYCIHPVRLRIVSSALPRLCGLCSTHWDGQQHKRTPWPESASELYRPSDRHSSAKLVPIFAVRGCQVVSVTDPHVRILGFLDQSRYYFLQVAPQFYSRG